MGKVLVACEYSGIVRDAFLEKGVEAISCDILPCESERQDSDEFHYQGDVRDILYQNWDMIIAHPPCTRLANSGVMWIQKRNLWDELDEGCDFFNLFLYHPCERICVENPVIHKYALERIGKSYDQKIQPWQFGHPEKKGICLWLKGLPPLEPTQIVETREARVHNIGQQKNRAKMRSRFFEGVAKAMADQWIKEIT
jgi:hypothetical protein